VPRIGRELAKKGLIRDPLFFRLYAYLNGFYNLQPGNYKIDPGEELKEILSKLKKGERNIKSINIPPGWTIIEIANRLSVSGINREKFIAAVKKREQKPVYAFEKMIPHNPGRTFLLEGYLAPGCYELTGHEHPEEIVEKMLQAFNNMLTKLNLPEDRMLDELLTIASLVEREGDLPEERPLIASVIDNRLRQSNYLKRLQVDATLIYMMTVKQGHKYRGNNLHKVREISHPYNTYLRNGLPPGPIANVSLESFQAALCPAISADLFYVNKSNKSREHFFARTFEEHKRNIKLSEKNSKHEE
jgi:UPF0755 protein